MGNRPAYFWLWDDELHQFIGCSALEEISESSNVALEDNGQISAYTRTDSRSSVTQYFEFEGNELIFIKEELEEESK